MTLSIVVPALNEAPRVGALARRLQAVAPYAEVVLVDGGSDDGTPAAARAAGLRVIEGAGRGRAVQMNAGAAATSGDQLIFLHADTALPVGVSRWVADTLADPDVALGAFALRLDRRTPALIAVEWGIALRCRLARLPYGDQALFLRRATFDALGGFRPGPLEDPDLVRRAARLGRIVVRPEHVVTSARRWEEHGALRTTLRNWAVMGRFFGAAARTTKP